MLSVPCYILEKASAGRDVTLVQLRSCRAEQQALANRGIDFELGAIHREDRRVWICLSGFRCFMCCEDSVTLTYQSDVYD